MKTVKLFDFEIFAESKGKLLNLLDQIIFDEKKSLVKKSRTSKKNPVATFKIFTPNPEQIVQANEDQTFKQNLKQADLLLPDGAGLVWASRLLKKKGKIKTAIKERITGVDLVEDILHLMKKDDSLKALIIGGREYADLDSEKSAREMTELEQNLFWTEAYSSKKVLDDKEEEALLGNIKELKPVVVFVALGAPDQEKWIIDHQDFLKKQGVLIAVAVGGSFDFMFSKVKRAPKILQKLQLEWFYRLIQEPWRWKRQLRLIKFLSLVGREF